jgi:transcriptional regulator with XRE-family HTH domain
MGKSRREFAELMGVSKLTVVRWELGYGCSPAAKRLERLRNLEGTLKRLKSEKIKF